MGIFHEFPYTNLHDLNIDWLLETMKKLENVYNEVPADLQELVNQWFEDHPEAVTTIADGEVTKVKLGENVLSTYVLIPDEFEGTDTQKLQACFNALENGGHIVINRELDLDGNIIHYLDSNQDKPIYIHGLGQNARINMHAYSFTGDWTINKPTGNLIFENIWFTGTHTCFDCNTLIRLIFNKCYFTSFEYVFNCTLNTNSGRFQSIYVSDCVFRRNGIVFNNQGQSNDIHIINNNFEYNTNGFMAGTDCRCTKVDISHNLFEGQRGMCVTLRLAIGCDVNYNYFESNGGYIDCNDGNNRGTVIRGNMAIGTQAGGYFVLLPNAAPLYTTKFSNVIEDNTMNWLNLDIIGIVGTPQSRIGWEVRHNYAPEIPQNIRFFLDAGDGMESYGTPFTDFDTTYCGGLYTTTGDALNHPASGRGNLVVYQGAGDNILQEFTPTNNNREGIYYRRTGTASRDAQGVVSVNWAPWRMYGPTFLQSEITIAANGANEAITLETNSNYQIFSIVNNIMGMYILHTSASGNGNVRTILAATGTGNFVCTNRVLTISATEEEQIIRIIKV